MKIAVFLPNWIGDAVMATPALRAVRARYPSAEIVGVARPYIADVLAGLDSVDRLTYYEPRGTNRDRKGWRLVRQLRREKFDTALLLTNSFRTGWMARCSGAKRRVGFARDGRGWMLTDRVRPKSKSQPHPALDEYLRLAAAMGCETVTKHTELCTLPSDEKRLEHFWSLQPAPLRTRGVVCLNPGGAFGAAKHWPTEHFAALAQRLAAEQHKTVLVLCGPAERETAKEIVEQANHEFVTTLARVPLGIGLTKAAVRHSELLVTTDSGPRHFAQPFGVPVVTLFGPTHIEWSETHYDKGVHLQLDVDCGPCQKRVCPLQHHKCLRDLHPDDVYCAATRLMSGPLKSAI